MKTTTNILILLSISNLAFSQVDGLTHTAGGANWYVGWDNTIPSSTVPLVIQHQGQQPIQFWHNDLNLGNTVIKLTVKFLPKKGNFLPLNDDFIQNIGKINNLLQIVKLLLPLGQIRENPLGEVQSFLGNIDSCHQFLLIISQGEENNQKLSQF